MVLGTPSGIFLKKVKPRNKVTKISTLPSHTKPQRTMKKLFLWGILVGLSGWVPAHAQKGTTYWGGTVNFSGKTSDEENANGNGIKNNNQHTVSPEIQWGKFVNSSTVVGLGLVYNFNWSKNTDESASGAIRYQNRSIDQTVEILPFVRKYKFLNERWAVFLHSEVGPTYGWKNAKNLSNTEYNTKGSYWVYALNVKPGLVYSFPGKKISIEGYANILSLRASYSPLKAEVGQSQYFNFSTFLSTSFPSAFELRLAKNINPTPSKP